MHEGLRTCHKCKKHIYGKMIYYGGWVWHPKCFPKQKNKKR